MSSLDCSFLASCFSLSFTSASCLAFMSFNVTRPDQLHGSAGLTGGSFVLRHVALSAPNAL
ncbi:hypothetical protein F7725_000290 [Dissostichus mawsoni]|uniref:Secreted protein n=1 Tax=Dissostichus mawsoni TaxID=36200 RepID=A0A7J5ZDZ0_DISMA|nr:hypothetical protein F7725_000290 [Dissostichus mawsoni]